MIRHLKYTGFFIVIIGLFSACSQTNKYIPNPNEQIVRELTQKRIVMLADFAHEWPLPYYSLTSILSTWLTMVGKGECDQNHLTLFLEESEQEASLIRQYLKTGDLNPLLDHFLPSTSLERLEFYSDLRTVTLRIDSMNGVLHPSKLITFDVQGPEAMNILDPRILDSSDRVARLFFVRDRDSLSAMNIITYLTEQPNQKGFIFYGGAHLIKKLVTKPYTESLMPEERVGTFLAYYLKREYGDNQVLSINQLARGRCPINFDEFDKTNVLVYSGDIPWKDSLPNDENLLPENFDAFFIRHEFVLPSHALSKIFSRRIIMASIKRIELLESHLAGPFGKRYYNQALRTLQFLSDTNFSKVKDWKSWWTNYQFDGFERLRSVDFRKRMANDYFPRRENPEYLQVLDDLGFSASFGNPRTMSRQEWDRAFNKIWEEIIFVNSIGIFWIGDPDEQAKAKAYLVEFSGQNYNDPSKYMKWWRRKYYSVSY
jgi:hypothetical protein